MVLFTLFMAAAFLRDEEFACNLLAFARNNRLGDYELLSNRTTGSDFSKFENTEIQF
jgi:hypothetical protein